MPNSPHSEFLHPRPELAQCILGGFLRDTRGCDLTPNQRFNHFAASPLCAVSVSFEGNSRILAKPSDFVTPAGAELTPAQTFSGPQNRPTTSWNDGDVYAMVIAFYPDAMSVMLGIAMEDYIDQSVRLEDLPDGPVLQILQRACEASDAATMFEALQADLAPIWRGIRPPQNSFGRMIGDWSRSLMLNAALSNTGRSLRQSQRRVKAAIGQPLKRLQTFTKAEEAFALALQDDGTDMAGIANDAGYSDQSHMGRHVRAQTGFTPTELLRGYESDEAFWSYRLMGQRF